MNFLYEVRERENLSYSVTTGLIEKAVVKPIIRKKLQLACLGAVCQQLSEIEDFDNQLRIENEKAEPNDEVIKDLENKHWGYDVNLTYFLEIVEPMVLKLGFLDGIDRPYTSEGILDKYIIKTQSLRQIKILGRLVKTFMDLLLPLLLLVLASSTTSTSS